MGGFLPALLAPILETGRAFHSVMNQFIEKIVVPKSCFNTRDCALVGRDATAMARLEKDMSELLEDPVLEPTEK